MFGQPERRSKNKFVQRERDRIKKDEEISDRRAELESIKNNLQKATFEGDTQTGSAKAMMRQELARQREAALGHTALTLVRREALRRLLEQERELCDAELRQRGVAIYQQRI